MLLFEEWMPDLIASYKMSDQHSPIGNRYKAFGVKKYEPLT